MRIYKYSFEVNGEVTIEMPEDAHILTVQVQAGIPCIWAIVEPNEPTKLRRFRIFGTGHELDIEPNTSRYIGTFQLFDGRFIGHRLSNLLKSQEQVINGERPVEYAISRGKKFDDMMASKKFNTVRRGR